MANPRIGYEYRLDVKDNIKNEAISWINNRSKKLYTNLDEINGRIVIVKSTLRIMTLFYIVALVENPKDPFYAPKKLLMEITRRLPIPCKCEMQLLLNRGCKCGAFAKEKDNSK